LKTLLKRTVIFGISVMCGAMASAQDAGQSIDRITGDVYRYHSDFYYSLVTVTNEGVVVVDPINSNAVGWLKRTLKDMTDQPVTHLIYSHSHSDHASGGVYFRAENIIAHVNAPKAIDGVKPTERFEDTKTFSLGDKTFELTWLGEGHSKDLIAVIVRPENVAFVVDIASPKRLPWRDFANDDIDGTILQIEKLLTLDFEHLAPGHGRVGVKSDAELTLGYLVDLRAQVLEGLKAGKTVEELQDAITMDTYQDWSNYSHVRLNVEGMAKFLKKKEQIK
jgi:glyoxylase-like metal-dependent hydrolase (beta-lactamase superfamily II)